MSRYAEAPLQKVTINIRKADYEYIKRHYGQGWSETIREVIHKHVVNTRLHDPEEVQ